MDIVDIVLVADIMFTAIIAIIPWVVALLFAVLNARHRRWLRAASNGLRAVRGFSPDPSLRKADMVATYRMMAHAALQVAGEEHRAFQRGR